jgi:lysine-N-methylase
MTETFHVLQPQYFERFRCLGSDCDDTCCNGWGILVDRATYDIYQRTPERDLVEINPASCSASDYAKIRLNGTRCPALQGGLCSLHRDHGETYISDMCSTFPRVVNLVTGVADAVAERSLHLSCPEAARLVLCDPDAMNFVRADTPDLGFRLAAVSKIDGLPGAFRESLAAIVRDRSRPLSARIVLVGQAIEPWESGDAVFPLDAVLELIVERIGAEYAAPRFLECYGEFMNGLGWTGHSTMSDLTARYHEAFRNYYLPFIEHHEHLFENYLLNYMFRTMFPFGWKQQDQKMAIDVRPEAMRNAYLLMVAHYAMIRTVLVGMAGLHRENLKIDHAVKLVYSATKVFQHSSVFADAVKGFFAARQEGAMQTAAALVTDS